MYYQRRFVTSPQWCTTIGWIQIHFFLLSSTLIHRNQIHMQMQWWDISIADGRTLFGLFLLQSSLQLTQILTFFLVKWVPCSTMSCLKSENLVPMEVVPSLMWKSMMPVLRMSSSMPIRCGSSESSTTPRPCLRNASCRSSCNTNASERRLKHYTRIHLLSHSSRQTAS